VGKFRVARALPALDWEKSARGVTSSVRVRDAREHVTARAEKFLGFRACLEVALWAGTTRENARTSRLMLR
jgi:hypothetical protein